MTIQQVREFFGRYSAATGALGALGAALDAHVSGVPLPAPLAARVDEVLSSLGAGDILDGVRAEEVAPVLGMLRAMSGLDAKLMYAESRTMLWSFAEPALLQAVGVGSMGHANMLSGMVVPALEGLGQRMRAPGAAFLDVGVGTGWLAIQMARTWPELHVVGIDPFAASIALARENIAGADMGSRIEVREQAGENLPDESAFDLAWVAAPFMQERAIAPICERVLRALRPGGWVTIALPPSTGDDPAAALGRLRMTLWAGHAITGAQVEQLLSAKGFVDVKTLPSPPGSPIVVVVGRRRP